MLYICNIDIVMCITVDCIDCCRRLQLHLSQSCPWMPFLSMISGLPQSMWKTCLLSRTSRRPQCKKLRPSLLQKGPVLLQVQSNVGEPCFAVAENGLRPCRSCPELLENNNAAPQGCPSVLYALMISFYCRLAFAYAAKPLQILSASTLCTNTVNCIAAPVS